MKRDMELVRLILLEQETGESQINAETYPTPLVIHNLQIMKDAGLIEANFIEGMDGKPVAAQIFRLTWAGHDFLDSARDPKVWGKVKESMLKTGVSWTFDVLKEALKFEAKKHLPNL